MFGVGCEWGWSGGWVLASHILRVVMGWVWIRVPPGLVGRPDPSHGTKCRPQSDHLERSDLAKRFFVAGWERERAERERGGRGLNTPQWDSARSHWLRSHGSCWLEVGAKGEFKLHLRKDHDPGKQKLKGAVRTETHQRHYCQQHWIIFISIIEYSK
jgi:hypothetical protein